MAPSARAILASLSVALLAAGFAVAADNPPQDLHLVGDHWTPWNPPSEFPEGSQLYTIQRGDTLWDLAAEYLGDPYLWPQLWERNQYILDAHWIYPGDPLVISVEVVPVETLAEAEAPVTEEPEEEPMFDIDGGVPEPLGSESDIYCSGFIGDADQEFPFSIIGSEAAALSPTIHGEGKRNVIRGTWGVVNTVKSGLSTSDIVYLDGGRGAGMSPGDLFVMVEPGEIVHHPLTHDKVGRFYRYLGRLRVLSAQPDTAIAEIVHSCYPATIGAALMPFVPEPVPLARRTSLHPVNMPASRDVLEDSPAIVHIDHSLLSMAEGQVVFIDGGADDDVTPGDVYTIYRLNTPGLPSVVMGELAVLSVHETTSVARILSSRYTVRLGDRLVLK